VYAQNTANGVPRNDVEITVQMSAFSKVFSESCFASKLALNLSNGLLSLAVYTIIRVVGNHEGEVLNSMLLTITTTHNPATDLGYLLHKNPAKAQTFDLNFGKAHVFYPLVTPEKCTAALLLEIDPVGLVRGGKNNSAEGGPLDQYVNDRPYVASSFMSVALKEVFGSALNGKCRDRPALAELAIPLEAQLSVVASRGGEKILRDLFEPLGYTLKLDGYPLDETQPDWDASPYFSLTLSATCRLSELLSHLYVLLPVLDNTKHYWISEDEIEKLLRHGEGWLAKHPAKEFIARRYLRFRGLVRTALSRLVEVEEAVDDPDEAELSHTAEEIALERPISLNESRLTTVLTRVKESGAKRVRRRETSATAN
jgi:3' terminal RNA ribose 2'-O-methyltransferase Hen1